MTWADTPLRCLQPRLLGCKARPNPNSSERPVQFPTPLASLSQLSLSTWTLSPQTLDSFQSDHFLGFMHTQEHSSFFSSLALLHGLWNSIPWLGITSRPSTVKAPSPNHWTIREFPRANSSLSLFFLRAISLLSNFFLLTSRSCNAPASLILSGVELVSNVVLLPAYSKVRQLYIYIYPLFARVYSPVGQHTAWSSLCYKLGSY